MRRILACGCAAVLALLAGAAPGHLAAQSPDRAQAEAMAQRAAERIRALHREADALAAQERTLLVELRRLEVERELKDEELKQLAAGVAAAERELAETTRRIGQLEQSVEQQRPAVEARFVELYKMGRAGYARLLLNVDDLRALGRAYRMVAELARLDHERVEEHRRTLDDLRSARQRLEARRDQAAGLQAQARAAQRALELAVRQQRRLVQSIDERRDLTAQLAGELQQAQQRLQASLAGLADGRPAVLPLRPFKGDLDWPAAGVVTGRFGPERSPRGGPTILRNGVEIAAPEGRGVRAIHDGMVAFADAFTGFGNLVIVDHGAQAFSLYGYLASLQVSRGARVERRQVIGTVGRGPLGTPGLYFELRIDGKPVDPIEWLKAP